MCSGSVSLQDIYNIYMLGPIEVTPDNQDNSISFMIPSSRENLNRFYDATITLINSAGSTTSNISNISELFSPIASACHSSELITHLGEQPNHPSYQHVLHLMCETILFWDLSRSITKLVFRASYEVRNT